MPRRVEQFRDLSDAELHHQEEKLSEQIFSLRFQRSTGQTEGLKRLREARRDLARVKTLQRERELRKSHGE
jgi:large subunit ribosomal protein L29